MQVDSTLEIMWARWDDPGASDGGGARVASYMYPEEITGALVITGDASEEIPAWHSLLELLDEYAPVESITSVRATVEYLQANSWRIQLLVNDFVGGVKPGYDRPEDECGGSEHERRLSECCPYK